MINFDLHEPSGLGLDQLRVGNSSKQVNVQNDIDTVSIHNDAGLEVFFNFIKNRLSALTLNKEQFTITKSRAADSTVSKPAESALT